MTPEPTELAAPAEVAPAQGAPAVAPLAAPFMPEASLGGYAEARISAQFGVTGNPYTFTQRLRPSFEIAPSTGPLAGRLNAEAVIEAALTEGRDTYAELNDTIQASEIAGLLESAGCEYAPEPRYDSVSDVLSVERLHVDLNLPALDIKIGRQAVRWGSGLYFHPTDLYAEVLLTEPWREPRGINAVRADVPIGPLAVTGLVAVGDDLSPFFARSQGLAAASFDALPLSAATKVVVQLPATDVAVIGQARASGETFIGGDVKGTLGVGYWVEGGWATPADGQGYAAVTAGLDYSFPLLNLFYIAAEYRYDGSGSDPDSYDYTARLSGSLPYDCAMLPQATTETRQTLGRHYAAGVLRVGVTQEFSVTSAALVNLADGTGALVPDLAYTASDRVVLHLGAQIPFGKDGEYRAPADAYTYTLGPSSVDLSGLVADATVNFWVRYSI